MAKRNLTVQLDEETIAKARVLAANRGTSVSRLVAQQIEDLTAADERYNEAWRIARESLEDATHGGGRNWKREDLYDR
ncbi:DUF6364 family protein [Actinopolymorpha sp. B17G11]|uniref:DUF6364 family protein n=1 Tax=unclassified Actinopolymorpha TaxID=2627063 RepID=UPI0032D9493C